MSATAASPLALILAAVILLAAVLLGRRIDVRLGSVHAQLTPNGGKSMRDAIDRIETQATSAVTRAEIAATQATVAADKAAEALERIERLEQQRPLNAAIVVTSPPEPNG